MKTLKKQIKSFAVILSVLILFHGCTVYKSTSVTLDEAYKNQTKVKVKTNDNQTLKFNRIRVDNGTYYGVKEIGNKMTQTPLEKERINKIHVKNKPLSTVLTVGGVLVTAGGFALLIYANSWSSGW